MSEAAKWAAQNEPVIERLRANRSKPQTTMLILHTKGAKTGREHILPLNYLPDGDRYVAFASIGGAPRNPAWYHNLIAHPDIVIEVDGQTLSVRAVEVKGAERDELFARQVASQPYYAGFQKKTKRIIPVIALEPR